MKQIKTYNAQATNQREVTPITKTCLYNFDPLKPHFYTVKLGFTGVYIIFLISAQNIDCGYSLEPPRRGGSNEYPQSMFWAEIWKISDYFIWNFSVFWRWNFLCIWIGVVKAMCWHDCLSYLSASVPRIPTKYIFVQNKTKNNLRNTSSIWAYLLIYQKQNIWALPW